MYEEQNNLNKKLSYLNNSILNSNSNSGSYERLNLSSSSNLSSSLILNSKFNLLS